MNPTCHLINGASLYTSYICSFCTLLLVYCSGSVCFPLHDSGGGRRVSYSQGYPSYPAIPRVEPGAATREVPGVVPL